MYVIDLYSKFKHHHVKPVLLCISHLSTGRKTKYSRTQYLVHRKFTKYSRTYARKTDGIENYLYGSESGGVHETSSGRRIIV